jgi:glucans biosynthesis protein
MPLPIDRRSLLGAAGLLIGAALSPTQAAAADHLAFGAPFAFSFEGLRTLARQRAAAPYAPPTAPSAILAQLDYQAWGQIKFDTDNALFADGPLPVTFFHLAKYFQAPVRIYAVDAARAREVVYNARYFDMPANSPARQLPKGLGFAGFRVQEPRSGPLDWRTNDWVAFLGASYFRAIGALRQYGLSARAVAIDTAVFQRPEEFPRFTQLFIERPKPGSDTITVCALLDGPSIAGACRFRMTRGAGVMMDVEQTFYLRRPVARLGLAPLTSMYWFSETTKQTAVDWRPEVHDSDGLAIWTGADEHIWRPLNDPTQLIVSAFGDDGPKGFGLLQRDRVFDHYLDGVFYDRRPSLWVEPKGSWGKGSVQLVEIPTEDETHDNIVAAWVPADPPAPGSAIDLAYRLHWQADEPYPSALARCVATRLGRGGQPGQPKPDSGRKFVVEFLGGPLATLPYGARPQMALHASRGRIADFQLVEPVADNVPGHWRVQFDLTEVEGAEPVELSLHLTVGGVLASETWAYQYHPI